MAEKKKGKLDQILDKLVEHDKRFGEIADRFNGIGGRFDEMDNKIKDRFDKVLTGLDKLMGELEKAREDRVFAKAKDNKQDQRLESLEQRTQKIEIKVG